jgi:excisionase family DNA binding protein
MTETTTPLDQGSIEYLSEDQAAKLIGIDKDKLQRLCRYGKISYFKVARRTRVFLESDLHAYLAKTRKEARWHTNSQAEKDGTFGSTSGDTPTTATEARRKTPPSWRNIN